MVEVDEAEVFEQERWTDIDTVSIVWSFNATGNDFYLPFGNILTTISLLIPSCILLKREAHVSMNTRIYEAIMAGDCDKARIASPFTCKMPTTVYMTA